MLTVVQGVEAREACWGCMAERLNGRAKNMGWRGQGRVGS